MDTLIARSEDTSADYSPPNDFNIARAFPVTDVLIKRVNKTRRHQQIKRIIDGSPFRIAAAMIGGFLALPQRLGT
jgi:hypothetical protein